MEELKHFRGGKEWARPVFSPPHDVEVPITLLV